MANANLFQQYLQAPRSITEYMGDLDRQDMAREQLTGARQRNALGELTMNQQMEQSRQSGVERNALQRIASGWNAETTPDQKIASLRNSGLPGLMTQADSLEKSWLDRRKTEAGIGKDASEAAGKDAETENKVISVYRDLIGVAKDPQTAAQYIQAMHSDPRLAKTAIARVPLEQALGQIGQDPQTFAQWKQQFGLGAEKFIIQNKPTLTTQNLGGTSRITATPGLGGAPAIVSEAPITQSADNRATNATSRANNRDTLAQGARLAEGQVTYQTDGEGNMVALPSRVAAGAVIRAQPVVSGPGLQPMPGKDAGLNETQSKALAFGSRMADARGIITEMEKSGVTNRGAIKAAAETAGRIAGLGTDGMGGTLADVAGTATNWTQSPEQRRYEAAKRNWIAATLRKESGAAIGAGEYRDADNQYFPQPNDDEATRNDKAQRRLIAEQTMLAEVPKGKRSAGAAPAGAIKPGSVLKFDAQGNPVP